MDGPARLPSAPPQAPRLSIVVPTLDEAGTVATLVARLGRALRDTSHEVIVVDDGSTDGTRAAARAAGAEHDVPVRVIHRANERGLATAVVRGLREARGEFVVVMDGDLQHPPEAVPDLVEAAQWTHADLVVGSRYVPGGDDGGFGPLRKCVSWTARRLAWAALPQVRAHDLTDPTSGLFLVRRDKVDVDRLEPKGYKVLLDILERSPVDTVTEVGFRFGARSDGESKLGPGAVAAYLHHIVGLAWAHGENRRLAKFATVGALGVLVNLAVLASLTELMGLHYLASAAVAVETSIVANFALNDAFTFRDRRVGRWWGRLARFNSVSLVALLVNLTVLTVLTEGLGLFYLASEAVAIGVAFLMNYRGNVAWTYGTAEGRAPGPARSKAAQGARDGPSAPEEPSPPVPGASDRLGRLLERLARRRDEEDLP